MVANNRARRNKQQRSLHSHSKILHNILVTKLNLIWFQFRNQTFVLKICVQTYIIYSECGNWQTITTISEPYVSIISLYINMYRYFVSAIIKLLVRSGAQRPITSAGAQRPTHVLSNAPRNMPNPTGFFDWFVLVYHLHSTPWAASSACPCPHPSQPICPMWCLLQFPSHPIPQQCRSSPASRASQHFGNIWMAASPPSQILYNTTSIAENQLIQSIFKYTNKCNTESRERDGKESWHKLFPHRTWKQIYRLRVLTF